MRDIKFRGKRIDNGKWIYGCLVQTFHEGVYILKIPSFIPAKTLRAEIFIEVHSESVGQYTGLKDKNGREIYEGDVIDCSMSFRGGVLPHRGEIVLDEKFGAFATKNESGITLLHNHRMSSIEVIGNKYDNPELLEK